jgi:hypothetical protein
MTDLRESINFVICPRVFKKSEEVVCEEIAAINRLLQPAKNAGFAMTLE